MIVTYKEGVTGSSPVAPTHKTAGQRPKPRLADETNGLFLGLGALLGTGGLNFVAAVIGLTSERQPKLNDVLRLGCEFFLD